MVESDERAERGVKQVEKRVDQEQAKATKALRALRRRRPFEREQDALGAAKELAKGLRYHRLTNVTIEPLPCHPRRGRPRKEAARSALTSRHLRLVAHQLGLDTVTIPGRRVLLATNVLDAEALDTGEVLEIYLG